MVEMVEVSLQKKLEETVPLGTKKVRFIRDRLIAHLKNHGEKCRPAFYRKLEAALVALDEHADRAMETARDAVSHYTENVWEQLIPLGPFHNMIWSSERAAYVSLYYNYECFLKECVHQAWNLPTYELNSADLGKVFNEGLGYKCTNDQEVQIAKHTRTSLVHNGGRAIPKLIDLPHRHKIEGDEIQIGASETTRLYHTLKDKALLLANAAKSVEALQLPAPEGPPTDAG
jgi:hypothetical protein